MNLKSTLIAFAVLASCQVFAQSSRSNIFGGYDYYNSNGSRAGWSRSNIFGGQDFYNSNGTRAGSTRPNIFGGFDYHRGGASKSIFSNEAFKERIDETAISASIRMRDIKGLVRSAWDLKGFEIIIGAKDENLNSDMLFNIAAQFAVEQNNAEALKAVIALAPECKKYEAQMALKAQTRGAQKTACTTAFPELVYLNVNDWKNTLKKKLKPWEQPMADVYICGMFRGLPEPVAFNAGSKINCGRMYMSPTMLATGAMELSNYDYVKDFAPIFEPAKVFAEAVEMAVVLKDKEALQKMATMYAKANFKNDEYASYIATQIAFLGNTRGMDTPYGVHPGTFHPSDAKVIRRLIDIY